LSPASASSPSFEKIVATRACDRLHGDRQAVGDGSVRATLGHEGEDLALAWREAREPLLVRASADDLLNDRGIDGGPTKGSGDVTVAFGSVWATSEHGAVIRIDPAN
jgi:hypothetical protein